MSKFIVHKRATVIITSTNLHNILYKPVYIIIWVPIRVGDFRTVFSLVILHIIISGETNYTIFSVNVDKKLYRSPRHRRLTRYNAYIIILSIRLATRNLTVISAHGSNIIIAMSSSSSSCRRFDRYNNFQRVFRRSSGVFIM